MRKKLVYKNVRLGKNTTIEENVRLGISVAKLPPLVIGDDAFIRSGSVIYAGSQIGHHLETGHYAVIREKNEIGDYFSIWAHSVVDYGCKIGSRVKIHTSCYVAQYTQIEDDVFLAPGVIIANDFHPGSKFSRGCMKGPVIKRGAQIGCNVTLLPFVTIGEHALIGAGSVVTKDIPDYSVAYGNPAKVAKKLDQISCPVSAHRPYDFNIP